MSEISDQQLLHDFADGRSEAAFSEIVRRHVDMVYSVAVRLMADRHYAEDVTQAVFSALVIHAHEVARKLAAGMPLSAWLHVTTRNLAAKTVRTEVRRRTREQEAAAMQNLSAPESAAGWDQIAPHIDHALAEMPERDRNALLLRFFERKTAREIGEQLGLNEDAAQKRVLRALERLRERLAARGVAVSSATAGGLLAAHLIQSAPAALAAGIVPLAIAGSSAAIVSASVASWPAQLLSTVAMTKTQTTTLVALAAVFAIPIGVQQTKLNELRNGLRSPPVQAPLGFASAAQGSNAPSRESEMEEIASLRRRADELRQQLTAKRAQPVESQKPAPAPAPTLLEIGKRVALNDLNFAGNQTPEAALQSMLTFRRDGNLDGVTSLWLLRPDKAEQWLELLASPEREQLARQLIELSQGAVLSSASQVNADGSVSDLREEMKRPEHPQNAVIEIVRKAPIDERRVQFQIKTIRGQNSTPESLTYGLTPAGWKEIP